LQPTLIDAVILFALIGTVLSACHRGLAKEMLHTVMFALMVAVGIFFMRDDIAKAQTLEELSKVVITCAFYLGAIYVFMWGLMKVVAPLILSHELVGVRSRFWAGALSLAKVLAVVLGLNLWFAVQSNYAHPARLAQFTPVIRDSVLINLSDKTTDDLYRWLASNDFLEYRKQVDAPPRTAEDEVIDSVGDIFMLQGEPVAPSKPE
jgi:hypothetical protein